jgi:hypothetical protein
MATKWLRQGAQATSELGRRWRGEVGRELTKVGMSTFTAHLVAHGADPDSANVAAVELFCLVEGEFLLGRTTRSAEPVRVAGLRAVAIVTEAVASVRTPTRQ